MFITKEGKLFGLINVIDSCVILAFICMIPSCAVVVKIMINANTEDPGSPRDLYVQWTIPTQTLPFIEELEIFEKIEPGTELKYNNDSQSYYYVKTPAFFYGYSWVKGVDFNRVGEIIEHKRPLGITGLILQIKKRPSG